ncbi:nuclear transport factor 2 family protein [Microbacterium oryzae]|uniref:YybH family protein n=1 Tax=Microbacterium oryzae TaxID=743009 RepID=UPI0025B045A9|nr:nuclear transport factor 2 family protein [Microbacterium oryzae]MDN3310332.1 nuclear transport factor 2 family protein [Microbacterium oryzae]
MKTTKPAADHDTAVAEVLALEERRQRALMAADVEALDAMFDESLVHIHAPGVTHTKSQLLEHVATRQAYLGISRGELRVRVLGDVAIIDGPLINRLRNPDGGERTLGGAVTQVLRRDATGAWRFVSFQMTPYGEQVWGELPSERAEDEGSGDAGAEQEKT